MWRNGTFVDGVVDTLKDIDCFSPPLADVEQLFDADEIRAIRQAYPDHCLIFGTHIGPFTAGYMAMGFERFFVRLIDDPAFVHRLLEHRTAWCIAMYQKAIVLGAEVVILGDDAGQKDGPMISPRMWRKLILPYHRRIVDALDVPVIWHSDGDITALLPMAIEAGFIGIHGLDPIAGMDLAAIKRDFGRDLVLIGNVDVRTLFSADLQAVRDEVDRCIAQGAPDGGYMIATCNSIFAGMHPAAVAELFRYEGIAATLASDHNPTLFEGAGLSHKLKLIQRKLREQFFKESTMHYNFQNGPQQYSIDIDTALADVIVAKSKNPAVPDAWETVVADALAMPIDAAPIASQNLSGRTVTIITDDWGRPTPAYRAVPLLLDALAHTGVADEDITFVTASGMHDPMSRADLARKLGEDVVARYRCVSHDGGDWDRCWPSTRTEGSTGIVSPILPSESPVLSGGAAGAHKIEGVGPGFIPPMWKGELADDIVQVSTAEAKEMTRRLARDEALFAGTSSGANVVAALRVAEQLGPGRTVATLACDSGLKYLSTDLFSIV